MGRRTRLPILGLAVGLTSGCTPVAMPFLGGAVSLQSSHQIPRQEITAPQSGQRLELDPATLQLIRQQDAEDRNLFTSLAINLAELRKIEPASSPNKVDSREQPAKPREKARKPVAPVQWPHADDSLLDLVQKDLDQAVAQPRERRRLQFSKAVVENPRVRYYINQYSNRQKDYLAKTLARSGKYFQMIANVLQEEGLPEEFAYLALIESNFSPYALSRSRALGLWQFVPSTARLYGLKIDSWVDERRDPVKSTRAAATYLKDLHEYFGKWYLATAAYNAGQGAIDRAIQTPGAKNVWGVSQKAQLSKETRNFVPRFVAISIITSNPKKYGFGDVIYEPPLEYEEVAVRESQTLRMIARLAETDVETIQELNPALLRKATPPVGTDFRLKLPVGKGLVYAKAYEQKEKEAHPIQVVMHKVQKGDTLFSIARRYGQEVRTVMVLNSLTSPTLRIGQQLKIILRGLRGALR